MPVTRLIAINGSAGAKVDVNASIHCRRFEIVEDDAGAAQGLAVNLLTDGFAATYTIATTNEPLKVGNDVANSNNEGPILGHPKYSSGGQDIAATKLASVISKTATATSIRVTEHE